MAWEKSPQWMIELFAVSLPERPGLERRKMFGFPAAFANGNMFAGVFQDVIFARLPPEAAAEVEAEYGLIHFEPMPGRPMRAYRVFPEAVLEDEARVARLLDQAYAFAAALPPKARKPRRTNAGKSGA